MCTLSNGGGVLWMRKTRNITPHTGKEGPSSGDMEMQLQSLYQERERLFEALGTADAGVIIDMIKSLEAQLCELYAERAHTGEVETQAT